MKSIIKLSLATALLGTAGATVIQYTGSVSSTGAQTINVSAPKFDPSLGTLTSVFIRIDSSSSASVIGDSESNIDGVLSAIMSGFSRFDFPNSSFRVTANFDESLDSAGVVTADNDAAADFVGTDAYDFGTISGLASNQATFTSGLSGFIGTGTVDGNVRLAASWSVSGSGAAVVSTSNIDSTADWTVEYTYTPTPVPEPSAALLSVAGLAALGFRRNRRA